MRAALVVYIARFQIPMNDTLAGAPCRERLQFGRHTSTLLPGCGPRNRSCLPPLTGVFSKAGKAISPEISFGTDSSKSRIVGYTEMCIQESEVGRAEVDGFKSYAPFSLPRALYSSGLACSHIKSSPTCFAVEVIRRPYISSRFSALYLAHSFSVRLLTSGEAIPNRRNDRIVARTLMLCCC